MTPYNERVIEGFSSKTLVLRSDRAKDLLRRRKELTSDEATAARAELAHIELELALRKHYRFLTAAAREELAIRLED